MKGATMIQSEADGRRRIFQVGGFHYLCGSKRGIMANMAGIGKFIKDWMLPLAIILGITSYLILFFVNPLARSIEPGFSRFAKDVQPVFMATMLFLQFNTISPHDLRFRKWHFLVLSFQIATFVPLTWLVATMPDGDLRILAECAMLCLICPTAAVAGVITGKLGGSLSDTVSYVVLINISVAGGLYSIWQNIINSLELYEQSHRTGKRINKH